jgi:hypothetical protein
MVVCQQASLHSVDVRQASLCRPRAEHSKHGRGDVHRDDAAAERRCCQCKRACPSAEIHDNAVGTHAQLTQDCHVF